MTQVNDVTQEARNTKLSLKTNSRRIKTSASTLDGDNPNTSGFFLLFFTASSAYFLLLIKLRSVPIKSSSRWLCLLLFRINNRHQTGISLTYCCQKYKSTYFYAYFFLFSAVTLKEVPHCYIWGESHHLYMGPSLLSSQRPCCKD